MKINEYYSVERDQYCFVLTFEKEGDINPKTGNPTKTFRKTYHSNMEQVLNKVLDDTVHGESFEDILEAIKQVREDIRQFVARKPA